VFAGIGNPHPSDNPHKELCEPADPAGYESITINDRKWKTKTGEAIFIHGDDSPNFEAPENERPPFPYLLTRKKKEKMLELCYGDTNSMEYWRNVIGFWPLDSVDTSVISRATIKNSDTSFEPAWSSMKKTRIAFLDCAWTSGGDRNEISYGYVAQARDTGKIVCMYTGTKGYTVSAGAVFEESLASNCVKDLIEMGVRPENFGMDVSGDGGKVLSAFIKEWQSKGNRDASSIYPMTYSGSPSNRTVSSKDLRKAKDVYDRNITEKWFRVHHAFANRCIYGVDLLLHRSLTDELCSRQYEMKGKKMAIETKKIMKSRLGKSPDKADSFVGMWGMAERIGVEIMPDTGFNVPEDEEEDLVTVGSMEEFGTYQATSQDEDGF
jgi:hypothetical protein